MGNKVTAVLDYQSCFLPPGVSERRLKIGLPILSFIDATKGYIVSTTLAVLF